MPTELYFKEGYGRRLRVIEHEETEGLEHLLGNLWSSLEEPHQTITVTLPGNVPLVGDGVLYAQVALNFGGIPLNSTKIATILYDIGEGWVLLEVELPEGTTASAAATLIAASPDWPAELPALAVANNFRVTPALGTTLEAIAVDI